MAGFQFGVLYDSDGARPKKIGSGGIEYLDRIPKTNEV
jgi:hypothetical protein